MEPLHSNYDAFLTGAVLLGFIVWLAEAVLRRLNVTHPALASAIDLVLKIVCIVFLVIVCVAVVLFVWHVALVISRGL